MSQALPHSSATHYDYDLFNQASSAIEVPFVLSTSCYLLSSQTCALEALIALLSSSEGLWHLQLQCHTSRRVCCPSNVRELAVNDSI